MGETGGGDRWYEFLRIPGQSRMLAFLFLSGDYAGESVHQYSNMT
jgi:hypothetical protein